MSEDELTAVFERLGATDPAGWARSQMREGIPQLARFLFLRQAWRQLIQEGEHAWIQRMIADAEHSPDEPYAGVGLALRRLKALGARDDDLTEVARGLQAEALFKFCYLLEDPGDLEPEVADMSWAFVQVDAEGAVLGEIVGLHDSVLETEPTGREMRPRAVP
jgi:hypothetical protein